MTFDFSRSLSRRQFVTTTMSAATLAGIPFSTHAKAAGLSVQQLIDLILKEVPGAPYSSTVDTIKAGLADQKVNGVVTTMFPTVEVIRKAIELRANFLIVHEPSFYNHQDETEWLKGDPVYEAKRNLLDSNKIAVWRFHDYIHAMRPDGVMEGVVRRLGWTDQQDNSNPRLFTIAKTPLRKVIDHAKQSLGIKTLRYIGDPDQVCEKVLMLPGAPGGRVQISQLKETKPDLLIAGELQEWETAEYMRDAQLLGIKRSLIVLGHAQSEEPGMEWFAEWLRSRTSGFVITHVPSNNPFTFA